MANKDIIQELNNLGSKLGVVIQENVYSVPEGYFENFPARVLEILKFEESLKFIASLPKNTPYKVPFGYFEILDEQILQAIRNHPDYQNSREELESISPLLSSLDKRPVYSVPQGYFDMLKPTPEEEKHQKHQSKVISIIGRKWVQYAAAAIVIGIIAVGAIRMLNKNDKIDPVSDPQAWVAKNMRKVPSEEINEFVKLADQEAAIKGTMAINNKTEEVKELMKDVPVKEIEKFLDETTVEDEVINDALSD